MNLSQNRIHFDSSMSYLATVLKSAEYLLTYLQYNKIAPKISLQFRGDHSLILVTNCFSVVGDFLLFGAVHIKTEI